MGQRSSNLWLPPPPPEEVGHGTQEGLGSLGESLPPEAIITVLWFLDAQTLCAVENTSAALRSMVKSRPHLWRKLVLDDISNIPQLAAHAAETPHKNWKGMLFKWRHSQFSWELLPMQEPMPSARYLHRISAASSSACDATAGSAACGSSIAYLFGGQRGPIMHNDVWRVQVSGPDSSNAETQSMPELTWHLEHPGGIDETYDQEPTVPQGRCATTWCHVGPKIYLFGGLARDGSFLDDVWSYDIGHAAWTKVSALKWPRSYFCKSLYLPRALMCFASYSQLVNSHCTRLTGVAAPLMLPSHNPVLQVRCQGADDPMSAQGSSDDGPDISSATPQGRWGHTAVEYKGRIWVWGGSAPATTFNDLWCLDASSDPAVWTQIHVPGALPESRSGHSATLLESTMYIFGGNQTVEMIRCVMKESLPHFLPLLAFYQDVSFDDTWALDLATCDTIGWRRIGTTGPGPNSMIGHQAIRVGSRILLHGGRNFQTNEFADALYVFDVTKSSWTRCSVDAKLRSN
ncbi:unnamed protein product [Chrysoparadoxa australica]